MISVNYSIQGDHHGQSFNLQDNPLSPHRISKASVTHVTTVDKLQQMRKKLFLLTQFQKRDCHPMKARIIPVHEGSTNEDPYNQDANRE